MQEANNKGRLDETGQLMVRWACVLCAILSSAFDCFALAQPTSAKSVQKSTKSSTSESAPKSAAPQTSPDSALLRQLEEAVEQENFLEAAELIKKVSPQEISQTPRLLVVKALIAKGLYKQEEAYELLRASLKIDNNFAPAQFEIALILMEKKEWRDAEVLLRLAGASEQLTGQRKVMLPYYLGVIAFETGRFFEARSSFLRLNWNESLDPALQQSMNTFVSRISKHRPWTVVFPLVYQYESNILDVSQSAPLPVGYSRKDGFKVVGGLFFTLEGVGFGRSAGKPFGFAGRLFALEALDSQFSALNVQFVESEMSWSKYLSKSLGLLKIASSVNFVRAGSRPLSLTALARATLFETDAVLGYEHDLQKSSESNKSSILMRISREQAIFRKTVLSLTLPAEAGMKIPLNDKPGENRMDISVAPALSYAPSKRLNLKLTEKLGLDRVSANTESAEMMFESASGANLSFTLQPYLIVSSGGVFSWKKNTETSAVTNKTTLTLTLLGLL